MGIMIKKRNGRKEILDITKIQKMTIESTADLDGVSQSELELDAQIKFVDGMSSSDIQDALIKTAVEKIDIEEEKPIKITKRKSKKVFEELDFELDSQE